MTRAVGKQRVAVIFNRDFEGAEADPENRAREDVRDIAENIVCILNAHGFESSALGITDDVLTSVSALRELQPTVVFNLCESLCGDNRFEALMPLLLDKEGISFTGSGPLALALALHKNKAKDVLRANGIPTPAAVAVTRPEDWAVGLPFPLIVKPSREDASVGIYSDSVVRDSAALERKVRHVLQHYRQPALVEQYIEGREIYVSLLGRLDGSPQVFPFFEIDFSDMPADRPRIVSFEGKWIEDSTEYAGTKPVRCTGLDPELQQMMADTAIAAFRAMEMRDYGRLDFRLHADGTPYIIDVNPNCDLSDLAGGYAKAARAAGLSYTDVIMRLVELAMARRSGDEVAIVPAAARGGERRRRPASGGGSLRERAP